MRHHVKICQHGDITLRGISSYCDKSYDVAQNRKKVYSERQSHDVATRRGALRRLASYCELGLKVALPKHGTFRMEHFLANIKCSLVSIERSLTSIERSLMNIERSLVNTERSLMNIECSLRTLNIPSRIFPRER